MNIAITGYYCTGSSAVTDLLKEYKNVNLASPVDGDYEHMLFYSPGGLFDLASILLGPYSSAYTSDMAINAFIDSVKRLNDNDFGWFGSYEKYYGDQLIKIADDFVKAISWQKQKISASHIKTVRFSIFKALLQIAARVVYKRPINKLGRKYVYDNHLGFIAMPTNDEFCNAARKYTGEYLKMCGKENMINIFDHVLWPHQCQNMGDLFPQDFKAIVVERDPRDVYLLNKYYWHKPPVSVSKPYFPIDIKGFCYEWKRTIARNITNPNVLIIKFEDLIYNYDKTLEAIEAFIGVQPSNHIRIKEEFNPDNSIENTQVFNIDESWKKEIGLIEKELSEFLYVFPYNRVPDRKLWFDTPGTTNVKIKSK